MSTGERKTVHVRIEGRVQGVWFRAWTEDEAASRGLDGWVRNSRDGSVEAVFSGPCDQVDDMIAACWEGPPLAEVRNVFENLANEEPVRPGFRPLPTA